MCPMSSRASGGALAASLITAAIVGFAGGAYFGTQAEGASADDPGAQGTTPGTSTGGGTEPGETPSAGETTEGTDPAGGVTLAVQQTAVGPNERIDLSGTVEPAAADLVLRLQRRVDDGEWEDFPESGADQLTATTRDDGTFGTWVTTGQSGQNAFRFVLADDDQVVSNEVEVTVG